MRPITMVTISCLLWALILTGFLANDYVEQGQGFHPLLAMAITFLCTLGACVACIPAILEMYQEDLAEAKKNTMSWPEVPKV